MIEQIREPRSTPLWLLGGSAVCALFDAGYMALYNSPSIALVGYAGLAFCGLMVLYAAWMAVRPASVEFHADRFVIRGRVRTTEVRWADVQSIAVADTGIAWKAVGGSTGYLPSLFGMTAEELAARFELHRRNARVA